MIKIIILISMVIVSVTATFCQPDFFARNKFLEHFITFELLNILAIILTVTLASIANIHLSLNRVIRGAFKDRAKGAAHASIVRREINQNGWALIGLFVLACVLLFLKGWPSAENIYLLSFVHSIGLTILFTNLLILFDIYQVIYSLVSLEGLSRNPPRESPETFDG